MADKMRVILEFGKKRRVVVGSMDWPGLDRWGTSEVDAIDKLLTYVPLVRRIHRRGPAYFVRGESIHLSRRGASS